MWIFTRPNQSSFFFFFLSRRTIHAYRAFTFTQTRNEKEVRQACLPFPHLHLLVLHFLNRHKILSPCFFPRSRFSFSPADLTKSKLNDILETKHQLAPKKETMVSDSELIDRFREFLQILDLNTTKNTILRRKLGEDFGIDLSYNKAFISEQVDLFLQNEFENAEEENGESGDDEEGDNQTEKLKSEETDGSESMEEVIEAEEKDEGEEEEDGTD